VAQTRRIMSHEAVDANRALLVSLAQHVSERKRHRATRADRARQGHHE
jgi:hypothetical protein